MKGRPCKAMQGADITGWFHIVCEGAVAPEEKWYAVNIASVLNAKLFGP